MDKKLILERRDELLKKLQKEVPNFNWEFQRLQTKGLYHNIDKEGWETEEMYETKYVFRTEKDFSDDGDTFKKVSGEIQISFRNEGLDIECYFNDEVSYSNKQRTLVPKWDSESEKEQWDKVREFFNTYMIPISKRIETKLHTPRIDDLYNGLYQSYTYEFNEILLKVLLDEEIRNYYKTIFNDFEDDYNKLMKENNQSSNPNGYFGTPVEMIKSFLEEREVDLEDYLEQQMEWIKKEELEN